MKYDHFLTKKLYLNTSASFEKDRFKDLNLRTTIGLSLGYQFFETKLTSLSTEAGLAYINEDFD
jgi:putative salt-induced outer membrane protein YdiY